MNKAITELAVTHCNHSTNQRYFRAMFTGVACAIVAVLNAIAFVLWKVADTLLGTIAIGLLGAIFAIWGVPMTQDEVERYGY